jgi:hypothetical protein
MSEGGRTLPRGQTLANLVLALLVLGLALGAAILGAPRDGIYADVDRAAYEAPASGAGKTGA